MPAFTSIVIKLALFPKAGEDAPLFRRLSDGQLGIPLNAINPQSVSSDVSEKLKRHAVLLSSRSETELDQVDVSKYKITLHYHDKDNDKILISNDGDLFLGMREHAVGVTCVLKVFADIQVKKTDKGVQNTPANNNVVVALADLITSAAVAANAGVDAAVQATVSTSKDGAKVAKQTARKSLKLAKSQVKAAKSQVKAAKALSKGQVQAAKAALKSKPDPSPPVEVEADSPVEAKPTPPPFIHGRHTCDGCLETPILGTRYHATNLPDYDLCSKCHDNYKGSSITFEPAQLDRDLPFQERWSRKYAKLSGGRRCGPPGRGPPHGGRRCGPRFGGPPHRFHGGPHYRGPPPPFGPHHHHSPPPPPPYAPHDPPPMNPAWPTPANKDWALEQAIKLSLQEQDKQQEEKQEPPVKQEEPDIVVEERVKEDEEETFSDCLEVANDDSVEPNSEEATSDDDEESTKEETDEEEATDEAPEPESKPDTPEKKEAGVEAVVEEVIKEVVDVVEEVSSHVSGDLIEFVGETLERVGHAIEGLNHELSKNSSHDEEDQLKIVDGDEDDDDDVSKGSWSVVGDDEAIARAAQMIGSSLFNSDNNVSTISNSQEDHTVSSLGTLPTLVPSVATSIPQIQTDRWAGQLEQLHALGFHDDAKLIEILESLMAANIGVDSDEDVSVTQVVDKLLKDW